MREAAVVDAVVVVELQVGIELASEAGIAGEDVSGERGSPAFVEDCFVERLDVAVGLGAAGVDAGVPGAESVEGVLEVEAAELVAIV